MTAAATLDRPREIHRGRRAAIYCRISLDREGAGLGVERQEEDCRAVAERLGWSVAEVFVDNDVSAYSGKPRPAYRRMLEAIRTGQVDAVVAWHTDRLHRSPLELEEYIATCTSDGRDVPTHTAQAGHLDLSTPSGRMVARQLGAVARYESEQKGARQSRAIQQGAQKGKQLTGGNRPYGYALEYTAGNDGTRKHLMRVTVNEDEAAIIRECAHRILAGEGLASVVADLNARGVPTSNGKKWARSTLRRVLCHARISGRREYIPRTSYKTTRPLLGEITSDTSEWPAIITPEQSDRLRMLLAAPGRRTTTGGLRQYLLSGVLRCGKCQGPIVAKTQHRVPGYLCNKEGPNHGCGRIYIKGQPTDDTIRDAIIVRFSSPEMGRLLQDTKPATRDLYTEIQQGEEELQLLAQDYGQRLISRAAWVAARTPIQARVDAARVELAAATSSSALDGFVGTAEEMRQRWESMNVSQRRAVVTAALEHVTVKPPTPAAPRGRFRAERLELVWRA